MVRASGAMMTGWILLWIATLAASTLITSLVRRYAIKTHLLDHPNHRSSHTRPTPRGGGIGIVSASLLAALALYLSDAIEANLALAFIGGGIAIAGVGFADDRRPVPVRIRLPIHIAAAVWATYWLGGLPPVQFGVGSIDLGFAGDALSVIAIVWVLNLFNFMDGIDGLAGSEAAFITLTACGFLYYLGLQPGVATLSGSVGMASLGFLIWNWPPAKIIMG
jgi:Fuc2NAc and GlcNAc transferase